MNFVCGSHQIQSRGKFRFYDDLEEFVCKSGVEGLVLGEDARDYEAFIAFEVRQPFTGSQFRVGVILDNANAIPEIVSIHERNSIAIGMNNCVQILDLGSRTISARFDLDSCLHHMLCNGKVLAAVHELGASVIQLADFREIANPYCEVVADATLSSDSLTLVSMDEETSVIDLTQSVKNVAELP